MRTKLSWMGSIPLQNKPKNLDLKNKFKKILWHNCKMGTVGGGGKRDGKEKGDGDSVNMTEVHYR